MRKMLAGLAVLAVAVAIGFFAIPEPDPFPVVPLPELGDGPITLTVVRALNPRFDALSEDEFEAVLDQTARLVRDHFGLEVRFERGEDYGISDLFDLIPPAAEEFAKSQIYPLPRPNQDPNRLAAMIEEYLDVPEIDADLLAEEVAIFIPRAPGMNKSELTLALARIWVSGFGAGTG